MVTTAPAERGLHHRRGRAGGREILHQAYPTRRRPGRILAHARGFLPPVSLGLSDNFLGYTLYYSVKNMNRTTSYSNSMSTLLYSDQTDRENSTPLTSQFTPYRTLYCTLHYTVPYTILHLTLYCTLHYTAPYTMLYLTLCCTLHYAVPYTILYLTLYCTLHHTLHYTVPYTILYLTPYFTLYCTLHYTVPYTILYLTLYCTLPTILYLVIFSSFP